MSEKMKVVYNPAGEREVHTFLNAYDLLAHAGYTVRQPANMREAFAAAEDVVEDEVVEGAPTDGTPDFAAMTKDKLETYAKENFNEDLDKRKSQATLAAEVLALYEEHEAE